MDLAASLSLTENARTLSNANAAHKGGNSHLPPVGGLLEQSLVVRHEKLCQELEVVG